MKTFLKVQAIVKHFQAHNQVHQNFQLHKAFSSNENIIKSEFYAALQKSLECRLLKTLILPKI